MRRRAFLAGAASVVGGCGRKRAPGEIDLWYSYGGRNRKVLLELVEQFHRAQSDIVIHPTFQGDYFEGLVKLRMGLFVGSVPTVTHIVGEVLPYLAKAGTLRTLNVDVHDLDPALAQSGTFHGGKDKPLVALPFNRSTPIAFYNKTLFDRLGHQPPTTWKEMRETAKAIKRQTGRWGFECPIDWWFWCALVGQAGGRVVEPDGTVTLGGKAGVEALEFWKTLVHKDQTMRPPPGRDYNAWQVTNTDFLAQRTAMIWTSTAFLRYLEDNAKFEVGAAPLPGNLVKSVPTGGTFFVIPRAAPAPEAGERFLKWMMQPAQANYWATSTGYMPVSLEGRKQLEQAGFFRKNPNFRVTLDQLQYAEPWPWAPQLFRVQREAVQPRLEAAVLGDRDSTRMLDEARRSLSAS